MTTPHGSSPRPTDLSPASSMELRCTSGHHELDSADPAHIGLATASVCAIAAWGAIPPGDLDGAAQWLRRGVEAIEAGSHDDGLVSAAAIHHMLAGGEQAVSDDFLQRSVETALLSDDLHRQIWVLAYAGQVDEALAAGAAARQPDADRAGERAARRARSSEGHDEAVELFWEQPSEPQLPDAQPRRGRTSATCRSAPARPSTVCSSFAPRPATGCLAATNASGRCSTRSPSVRGPRRLRGGGTPRGARSATVGSHSRAEAARPRSTPSSTVADDGCSFAPRGRGRELDAGAAVAEALIRIEVLSPERDRDRQSFAGRWRRSDRSPA